MSTKRVGAVSMIIALAAVVAAMAWLTGRPPAEAAPGIAGQEYQEVFRSQCPGGEVQVWGHDINSIERGSSVTVSGTHESSGQHYQVTYLAVSTNDQGCSHVE